MSTFEQLISMMSNDAPVTKTASESAPEAKPVASNDPSDRMLAVVRGLSEKTAAAAAPQAATGDAVASLQKIAADTAALEDQVLMQKAKLAGYAMFDGFVERQAQVGGAVKTASEGDLEKVAQAAYAQAVADMEKQASDAYASGFDAQVQHIHKIAAELHLEGQASARNVLQALGQGA